MIKSCSHACLVRAPARTRHVAHSACQVIVAPRWTWRPDTWRPDPGSSAAGAARGPSGRRFDPPPCRSPTPSSTRDRLCGGCASCLSLSPSLSLSLPLSMNETRAAHRVVRGLGSAARPECPATLDRPRRRRLKSIVNQRPGVDWACLETPKSSSTGPAEQV